MQEFEIYKQGIKLRLARMNDVAGGEFSKRELKIISIVWNHHDEILQEIQNEMTRQAIDDGGGCSVCGDLSGFECICEEEDEMDDELKHYLHPSEDIGFL